MNSSSKEQRRPANASKKRGSKIPTPKSNGSNPEGRKRSRIPLKANGPASPEPLSPESPPPALVPALVPEETRTTAEVRPFPLSSAGGRAPVRKSKLRSPASFSRPDTLLTSTPKSRVPEVRKNGNAANVQSKIPKARSSPATEQSRLPKHRSNGSSDTPRAAIIDNEVSEEELIFNDNVSSLSNSEDHYFVSESMDDATRDESGDTLDDNANETEDTEPEIASPSPDRHPDDCEVSATGSLEESARNALPENQQLPREGDSEGAFGESGFHDDSDLTPDSSPLAGTNPESDFFEDDGGLVDGSNGGENPEDHREVNGGAAAFSLLQHRMSIDDNLEDHRQTNDGCRPVEVCGVSGQEPHTFIDGRYESNGRSFISHESEPRVSSSSSEDLDVEPDTNNRDKNPEYEITEMVSTPEIDDAFQDDDDIRGEVDENLSMQTIVATDKVSSAAHSHVTPAPDEKFSVDRLHREATEHRSETVTLEEEYAWENAASGIVVDTPTTEVQNLNGPQVREQSDAPEAVPEGHSPISEDFGHDYSASKPVLEPQISMEPPEHVVDGERQRFSSSSDADDSSDGSETGSSKTSSADVRDNGPAKSSEPADVGVARPVIAAEPADVREVRYQTVSWRATSRTVSPPPKTMSNTEKILATSNMLKACIGQASAGTKVRSLRATMPMLTRFDGTASSTKGGEEDDRAEKAIEDVHDVSTLQQMLDSATNYDQRRRIRAQMRNLKKTSNADDNPSALFLIDAQSSGRAVNRQQPRTTSEVGYGSDGQGGNTSAQRVWQAIDSMVASSLTVDAEFAPVKNGNSSRNDSDRSFNQEDPDQTFKMGDTQFVNGVNLAECNDELKLHELLDNAEDYEDRKIIRSRLKDVLASNRAQREEIIRRREEEREESIRSRLRDANEQKRRTLAMYDAMAKSAPAGGNKVLDVGILRGEDPEHKENYPNLVRHHQRPEVTNTAPVLTPDPAACTLPATGLSVSYSQLLSVRSSGSAANGRCYRQTTTSSSSSTNFTSFYAGSGTSTPTNQTEKIDFVEESIRQRVKESDDRKKVILAAFDQAAKSGPAGSARFVDFDGVKAEDIYNYENNPKYTSTFQMKGGVPIAKPAPPVISRPALHPQPYDPEEAAIRRRKQDADDRKRRTLQAYDTAAKSRPAGTAFSVYIPSAMDIEPVVDVAKQVKPLPVSPRERFQRMDSTNAPKGNNFATAAPATPAVKTNLVRSPTAIKEMLLNWCKSKTKEYENIKIENFSTAWNDGMAFCALIHHFYPDAFDFNTLNPKNRRANFELAFRVAEEKGDVAPLLDVEDMVVMKKPDWKCVFTYVQSIYRRFHNVD